MALLPKLRIIKGLVSRSDYYHRQVQELERIAHTQISKYVEDAKALSPHQGGFKKGKSTIDTVANFTE